MKDILHQHPRVELDSAKTNECNLLGERSVNERHQYNMAAKFVALIVEKRDKLHMLKWYPQLHKSLLNHIWLLIKVNVGELVSALVFYQ